MKLSHARGATQDGRVMVERVTDFHYLLLFFFLYGLLQDIECRSLCCTVRPCYLPILHKLVCILSPWAPRLSLPDPSSTWHLQVCSSCVWACFCVLGEFTCVMFWVLSVSYQAHRWSGCTLNFAQRCSRAQGNSPAQLSPYQETADKMWSTGEGNGKPLQYSYLENPMNSMKSSGGMCF